MYGLWNKYSLHWTICITERCTFYGMLGKNGVSQHVGWHSIYIVTLYVSVETGSLTLLWWLWVFSLLCYLNLLNLDLEKPQAMKKFTEGDALQTLDPRLPPTSANNLALEKVLELALQCLGPTRQSRPSMRRCAEILWGIRKDYRELAASDLRSQSSHSQRSSSVREE